MNFLFNFLYKCRTFVIPTLLVMIIVPIIYIKYGYNTAWWVSNLGMFLVCVGNIIYIIGWCTQDSRLPWDRKLVNLLTFKNLNKWQ
jgi:hypothetical protein